MDEITSAIIDLKFYQKPHKELTGVGHIECEQRAQIVNSEGGEMHTPPSFVLDTQK